MDRRLRRAVLDRLAAVEEMVLQTSSELPVQATRRHIKTITSGWRELLLAHQPDDKGRCPVCSGWLRRRRWPCQVWVTAHQHLISDRPALPEKPGREALPSRQPRRVDVIPRQVGTNAAADQSNTAPAERTGEWITPEQVAAQRIATQRMATQRMATQRIATQRAAEGLGPTTTGSIPIYRAAVTGPLPVIPPARSRQRQS